MVLVGPMPTQHRDLGDLPDMATDVGRELGEVARHACKIEEHFVDGVGLDDGNKVRQHFVDAPAHAAKERLVGRVPDDRLQFWALGDEMIWLAHLETEVLGLAGQRNGAAIIVGEDHERLVAQLRVERPLARAIEAVRVDQGEHQTSVRTSACTMAQT